MATQEEFNRQDWVDLRELAAMFSQPITVEALRLRLLKPDAPMHRKLGRRWIVLRSAIEGTDFLARR